MEIGSLILLTANVYRNAWLGVYRNASSDTLLWEADQSPVTKFLSKFSADHCFAKIGNSVVQPTRCSTRSKTIAICQTEATCDPTISK